MLCVFVKVILAPLHPTGVKVILHSTPAPAAAAAPAQAVPAVAAAAAARAAEVADNNIPPVPAPSPFFAVQSPAGEETGTMTACTERPP